METPKLSTPLLPHHRRHFTVLIPTHKTNPTIKLETLSSKKMKIILFSTYFILIASTIIGFAEDYATKDQQIITFNQQNLNENIQNHQPSTSQYNLFKSSNIFQSSFSNTTITNTTYINTSIQLDPINMYFSILLNIDNFNSRIVNKQLNLSLYVTGYDDHSNIVLYNHNDLYTLICNINKCNTLLILDQEDYAFTYEAYDFDYYNFNITVICNDNLYEYGDINLIIQYSATIYRITCICGHWLFICISLFLFMKWCKRLYKRTWTRCLPEQKWM
jgi:hypothetical protein